MVSYSNDNNESGCVILRSSYILREQFKKYRGAVLKNTEYVSERM